MDEIKKEYDLCIKQPSEYKKKVNSISDLLLLKGSKRLIDTDCPVFIVGNYETAPIVMFGINPGYSSKNNPTEDREARISWEHYLQLYKTFYKYFESNSFESPYYNALRYLISGLIRKDIPNEQKWKFFDRYLINIELIPYHSTGISFPNFLSNSQLEYLLHCFQNSIDFIINYRPKLFIFNGSPWYILLIKNNIIKNFDKVTLTKKFSLYFFSIQGIPCVLFDKFFQRHFWGITNEDRKNTIPNLIYKKYPVCSFTNPTVAYEHIKQNPIKYSWLITDYQMPNMNGLFLATKLLEIHQNLKVIIMSCLWQLEYVSQFRFIRKPISLQKFVKIVNEAMSSPLPYLKKQ